MRKLLLPLLLLLSLQSCFYYKVDHSYPANAHEVLAQQEDQRFVILHHKDSAWHFTDIRRVNDSMLFGRIQKLPPARQLYKVTRQHGANRYYIETESYIVNETHLYANTPPVKDSAGIKVPVKSLSRMDVYVPAKGATIASTGALSLLAFYGALIVLEIIIVIAVLILDL